MARRALLVFVLVSVASVCPAVDAPPAASAPGGDPIEKLEAALKAEGEAFAAVKDDAGPTPSKLLASVKYSADNITTLNRVLSMRHGKDMLVDLYVSYQLAQPLAGLDTENLRRFKSTLTAMLEQRCQYRVLPNWPAQKLLQFSGRVEGADVFEQMEKLTKLREEKNRVEFQVVKHNRVAGALAGVLKKLLLAMDDTGTDDAITRRLAEEEGGLLLDWKVTLEAIKEVAPKMAQARAKKFYDRLKELAFTKGGTKKSYRNPTSPLYNPMANSAWQAEDLYFAIPALQLVNVLAKAANEQEVKVPEPPKPK